jgi:hypothetical protein
MHYKVCLYKTITILCFPPCTPIKLPIYVSRNTMQKCNYLLQKKLSSWPLSQAPFQWEGTGPRPSSLKLSDSGHTPFHHRERIERKKTSNSESTNTKAASIRFKSNRQQKYSSIYVVDTEQTLGDQWCGCIF